jgi:5-methylcytosine-specific restriction endonuclease McrA
MPREKGGTVGGSRRGTSTSSTATKTAKKRTRTPDYPEWPEWSEAKFWSFIRSGLRSKWQRWPAKWAALAQAKEGREYRCASCNMLFKQKQVQVDHIIPAGSLKNADDLAGFITRLFVGPDKLRVVCIPCHKAITKEQRNGCKESND